MFHTQASKNNVFLPQVACFSTHHLLYIPKLLANIRTHVHNVHKQEKNQSSGWIKSGLHHLPQGTLDQRCLEQNQHELGKRNRTRMKQMLNLV